MLVVYSPRQKDHQPLEFVSRGKARPHPDVPERIDALLQGVDGHRIIEPRDHGMRHVAEVHTARYLDFLAGAHAAWTQANGAPALIPNVHPRRTSEQRYPSSIVGRAGYHLYDLSCPITQATWPAVLWNSHCAAEAALRVGEGAIPSAYALCRPPGHHAGADFAGGFCYLNNAAIAASLLARRFSRIAVLDVDVHHGNGTQDIFFERGEVLVVSLHGDPSEFYPFYWGYSDETGAGAGQGGNLNIPLARGLGDDGYLAQLNVGLDRIRSAHSQALVVSLGLDAYEHDPLSWLKITTEGFGRIGARIAELGLPTVLVQEGGYFCRDLGRNLASFLRGFEDNHRLRARAGA